LLTDKDTAVASYGSSFSHVNINVQKQNKTN